MLLHDGIQEILQWSSKPPKTSGEPNPAEDADDDLFGNADAPAGDNPFAAAGDGELPPNPFYVPIRREVHKWIVRSPKLKNLFEHAEAVGCTWRLRRSRQRIDLATLKVLERSPIGRDGKRRYPVAAGTRSAR